MQTLEPLYIAFTPALSTALEVDATRIYAACQDSRVYAFGKRTGDVLWFTDARLIDCSHMLRRGRMLHCFTQLGRMSMDVQVRLHTVLAVVSVNLLSSLCQLLLCSAKASLAYCHCIAQWQNRLEATLWWQIKHYPLQIC